MSFGKGFLVRPIRAKDFVSILVLMDVVREGVFLCLSHNNTFSFNPCSNGCRSGRDRPIEFWHLRLWVSILVLMDVVRED